MVVHPSQVVEVPDDLTDEQAVLIEPVACAVHAARQVGVQEVAVIGAGALGLFTIAALRSLVQPSTLVATAKHPEQRRWAKELGADVVCAPGELDRAVRSATSSFVLDNGQLTCGIDAVVDCVGSEQSLGQAIRVVAPGGTVHMVGMPGVTTLDLTPVWQREVALRGVYAYDEHDDRTHDFATAVELIRGQDLGRLVTAAYPLSRYEDAIDHAAHAGVRGAVKVAFDLRAERTAR
jgi:threonine dehydrogenase-like Zn-dependent dehydrogenase